jgi:hypothetical protein
MSTCIKNSNTLDTIETPQHFSEFRFYNFDIGLQSIGTDSESETKEGFDRFQNEEKQFYCHA